MPPRNGLGRIRCIHVGILAVCFFSGNSVGMTAEPNPALKVEVVSAGSSTAATRKKALAEVPVDQVTAEFRPKIDEILKNVSLFRHMPTLSILSEPETYQFFIAHPDVAVSLWRVMEISTFELWQIGPTSYEADSHDGSTGTIEVLHASPERHLVLCEGSFKSPILPKPIKARALLHLQPTFRKGDDGQIVVTHALDLFVSFPSQPVDITAKLISPVSHAMADRNFREVSLWVAMMNVAMYQQPGWIEQLATKMEGIPEIRRGQFLKMAAQTYVANRKRLEQQQTGVREVSLDQVISTLKKSAENSNSTITVSGAQPAKGAGVETADGKRKNDE